MIITDSPIRLSDTQYLTSSGVFVQAECDAKQALDEINSITELANENPNIKGIIAWAPLELGLSAEVYLSQLRKNPLVKGVRRTIQFENDNSIQLGFVAGVQLLAYYDLPFDICTKTHELSQIVELINQCPDVRFMLNGSLKQYNQADLNKFCHENAEQLHALS